MVVTRQEAGAQPMLVSGPPPSIRGRRVLVVDETCDTGSTMKLALSEVRALKPAEVRSAVSFKTGDYAPDFHAFETDNFIILPWDREIIQGGEIIVRPGLRRPALIRLYRQHAPDLQLAQVVIPIILIIASASPPGAPLPE